MSAIAIDHATRFESVCDAARTHASAGDARRDLAPEVVAVAKQSGLFCMALPERFGGLGLDPLDIVDAVERLSHADGAAGWCGFIGNATAFFGWLEPDVIRAALCDAPGVAAASIFGPTGQARPAGDGGYTVSGRWAFASGSGHSEWTQLGVMVMDGDRPAMRADGQPDWRFAFVPTDEVTIVDTWDTIGLRGTGSNDIVAEQVVLPAEHLAMPMFDEPRADDPIFRFGFWGLLPMLMAPHPLGVARRSLDELEVLLPQRTVPPGRAAPADDPQLHYEVGRARAAIGAARAYLDHATGQLWSVVQRGDAPTDADRRPLALAMQHAMATALEVVETSYRFAGTSALHGDSVIQRCFRDVHTARMHVAFGLEGFRGPGRELLASLS